MVFNGCGLPRKWHYLWKETWIVTILILYRWQLVLECRKWKMRLFSILSSLAQPSPYNTIQLKIWQWSLLWCLSIQDKIFPVKVPKIYPAEFKFSYCFCDSIIYCHPVESYSLKHIRMLLLMREQLLDFWAGQCLCLFTDTPGGVIWKLLSHQLNFYTACYFKCDASIILDKNVNDCNVACIDLLILICMDCLILYIYVIVNICRFRLQF